jgi:hypothetical protein
MCIGLPCHFGPITVQKLEWSSCPGDLRIWVWVNEVGGNLDLLEGVAEGHTPLKQENGQ